MLPQSWAGGRCRFDPRTRRNGNCAMWWRKWPSLPEFRCRTSYLLERERGINAFAAGHDLNDAAICVTNGAVKLLDRDELQGVVAHEFSHILNGDMRLNLSLAGWLNGILMVSQVGEMGLRGVRRTGGRGAGAIALVSFALYAVGYVGYFFGRLIKSAVSRQREYLGDASAAQFTRLPEGLAGALKKIGGLANGSRIDHPRADEMSHLFFSNALQDAWLHALDTHPPLEERIRRLDASFKGKFPEVTPLPAPPPSEIYLKPQPPKAAPEPAVALSGAEVIALLSRAGDPMQEHLDRARYLLNELPEPVISAVRDPFGACAVVYGLLLDRTPAIRARQEEILSSTGKPGTYRRSPHARPGPQQPAAGGSSSPAGTLAPLPARLEPGAVFRPERNRRAVSCCRQKDQSL